MSNTNREVLNDVSASNTTALHMLKPSQVGLILDSTSSDVSASTFDVIIIGGGTAGLALASRLSENAEATVLVLEAGGSSSAVEDATIPSGWRKLIMSEHDWKYFTAPQLNGNGVPHYWPRGKFLGGCSSINGMMFHHCAPEDYDEWARLGGPGADIWAYKRFKDYLRKIENFSTNESKVVPTIERGTKGLFSTGYHNFVSDLGREFLESCNGAGIVNIDDYNTSKGTLGSTLVATAITSDGRRVSTETAYLSPKVLARPNLKIATGCHVRKIVFEMVKGTKTAVGVEFSSSKEQETVYRATASKEVVLSAGGIETPHILLLSGVGPVPQLKEHSIPVVHDLPGVGAKLYDHPTVILRFKCKDGLDGKSLHYLTQPGQKNDARLAEAVDQFKKSLKGPLSSGGTDAAAFFRSTDDKLFPLSDYPNEVKDCTSGPKAPDLEIMLVPFAPPTGPAEELPEGDYVSLVVVLLRPQSVGSIMLKSSSPFESPLIDPNYFSVQNDVEVLTRGVKMALKIAKSDPLASSLDFEDTNPILDFGMYAKTDEELESIVKMRGSTTFHPCATASMGPLKDGGVVDARLRVHGIPNLRVIDSSIFPSIPSGHTMAPVIALGERGADLMKEDLKLGKKGGSTIGRIVRHLRSLSYSGNKD